MVRVPFKNGGFVLHRITHLSKGNISAWFDKAGKLLDAEQRDALGRSRSIPAGGPLQARLDALGRVHAA